MYVINSGNLVKDNQIKNTRLFILLSLVNLVVSNNEKFIVDCLVC